MSDSLSKSVDLLAARLRMFSQLLDKVEGQWAGRDIDALAASRLAPDMYPLYWQVAAVALQIRLFAAWCRREVMDNSVPELAGWQEARAVLRQAQAELEAAGDAGAMPDAKRIEIGMIGMYLDLSGQRYLDDWILPNLYFHMTTAYAIMRMQGAEIGKGDFLSNLMGELRPMAELEQAGSAPA